MEYPRLKLKLDVNEGMNGARAKPCNKKGRERQVPAKASFQANPFLSRVCSSSPTVCSNSPIKAHPYDIQRHFVTGKIALEIVLAFFIAFFLERNLSTRSERTVLL